MLVLASDIGCSKNKGLSRGRRGWKNIIITHICGLKSRCPADGEDTSKRSNQDVLPILSLKKFAPSLKKVRMTQFHGKRQAFSKRMIGSLILTDYLDLIFLISLRDCDNFSPGCPDTRFKSVHWLSQNWGTLCHCSLQSRRGPSARHLLHGFNVTPSTQVHPDLPRPAAPPHVLGLEFWPHQAQGLEPCGKSIDCGSRKQVLVTVVSVTLGRSHPHPGPQFPQLSQERLD